MGKISRAYASLFRLVTCQRVRPTNNAAKRGLWEIVTHGKIRGAMRSEDTMTRACQPVHMHDRMEAARFELFHHGSNVRLGWTILLEMADFAAQRTKSVPDHLNRCRWFLSVENRRRHKGQGSEKLVSRTGTYPTVHRSGDMLHHGRRRRQQKDPPDHCPVLPCCRNTR